eukprot:RCo008320
MCWRRWPRGPEQETFSLRSKPWGRGCLRWCAWCMGCTTGRCWSWTRGWSSISALNLSSTRMFPLRSAVTRTLLALPRTGQGKLIFAGSLLTNSRTFTVDLRTGSVLLGSQECSPPSAVGRRDGLLRWMEEYVRRLQAGIYTSTKVDFEGLPMEFPRINLFPDAGPEVSVVVTRGIEARASAMFVTESPQVMFTYSIRLRVVDPDALGCGSAQLSTRHWRITDGLGNTEEVHGNGVIGKYPVLFPGGFQDVDEDSEPSATQLRHEGFFCYQSCTGRMTGIPPGQGTFQGHLRFIPGTLHTPLEMPPFDVVVGPFPLKIPEYMY